MCNSKNLSQRKINRVCVSTISDARDVKNDALSLRRRRVSIFFHSRSPDNFTIPHGAREWYRFIVLAFIIRFRLYDRPAAHLANSSFRARYAPSLPSNFIPRESPFMEIDASHTRIDI